METFLNKYLLKHLARTGIKHYFDDDPELFHSLKQSCLFVQGLCWFVLVLLWQSRFKCPPSVCLCVLPEYLEVVWRSLASENAECPLLVKKASDTLIELLKDPKTYDNITKDFK